VSTLYHQVQGLYTAGDVMTAVECVRALPEYRHVFFVNHGDGFDTRVHGILTDLGAEIRRSVIVTEADVMPDLRAVFYHCVGHDDSRRGEYVRFSQEPPGVILCAWIHTPGLCGGWSERYKFLGGRGTSTLICDSAFGLHNTPGLDLASFTTRAIINPVVDADHFAGITRVPDGVFRIGRWSRGDDAKYSDDFLELLAGINVPGVEFACMGVPPKFRGMSLPPNVRFYENGEISVEELLAQLDVLLFKTHAPAWHEGWCRTVTEAMAAGVVPVVENRGGIPDQVLHGYNGFLCDTNAEFTRYCELLYHDPALRARMSDSAAAFVRDNINLTNLRTDLLRVLEPRGPRRLNLGCGLDVRPGFINADTMPLPGVDAVLSVDPWQPRLPFVDEEFDEIIAFHVLEHVANKNMIVEELWRIARHNAVIRIKVPDRRHSDAFIDPTHLSFWEVDTIDFYFPGHLRSYYSPAKFGLLGKYTTEREIGWELLALRRGPRFETGSNGSAGDPPDERLDGISS
jgi:glycosyltransferase involved in cell wall biosynthesis